jgi:dTDP-4-amino-4,6-dideoxygalactose transaminase
VIRDLPYGLHTVSDDDAAAVAAAVTGPLLASGPRVEEFERQFCERVGAETAIACSSGTAALQLSLWAMRLQAGDICVVPPVTFLSTATAPLLVGADVRFADVDPETGLMTPETLAEALAAICNAKAVIPVHLGGRLCDMPAIHRLSSDAGAQVVEDCCHALGGVDDAGTRVGGGRYSLAKTFSFHPVKMMTTGEGGMVTTNDGAYGQFIRQIRNHSVTRDPAQLTEPHSFGEDGQINPWAYEQTALGHNFRMSEMQGALGSSQLGKLQTFVEKRQALSNYYNELLGPYASVVKPTITDRHKNIGAHLYTVNIDFRAIGVTRSQVMRFLLGERIGTQVHYIPVYRQPYFKSRYGELRLPGAEQYYERTLTLPLFPLMDLSDVERVVSALVRALGLASLA